MDFREAYINGLTAFEKLDDWVEYWHTHNTHNELQEFLGITDAEYGIWLIASNVSLKFAIDMCSNKTEGKQNV